MARGRDGQSVRSGGAQREPRDDELRRVTRAILDNRGSGRSQLLQIDGAIGSGKSVFVADLLGAIVADGVAPDRILRVNGRQRESDARFGALHSVVEMLIGDDAIDSIGGSGGHVLAIDDADLLDRAEIDHLKRTLLLPTAPPLTLVLVHRNGRALGDVLATARSRGMLHEHVTLGPLSDDSIAEIVAGLDTHHVELVVAASSGNPLFARVLHEAFRRCPESHDVNEALHRAEQSGSEVLGAAVMHDLETLGHKPRRVFEALAVVGSGIDTVEGTAGMPPESYAEGVRELRARRLMPRTGQAPLHPVIRHAVSMHVDDDSRVLLNRRASRLPGIRPEESADQLAQVGNRLSRVEAADLTEIARNACETTPVSVVRWLQAIPREHRGPEAQLILARALLLSGGAAEAIGVLRQVIAQGAAQEDTDEAAPNGVLACALLARAQQAVGQHDEAKRELISLQLLPLDSLADEVLREIADAWMLVDGVADSELLRRLHASSDGEARRVSATYEVFALLTAGDTARAREPFAQVSAQWLEVPDEHLPGSLIPLVFATWSAHVLEQYDRCRQLSERGIRVSLRHGRSDARAILSAARAYALMHLGRLAEADEAAEGAARDAARHGPQGVTALAYSALVISAQARAAEGRGEDQLRERYGLLSAADLPQMVWWRRVVLSARSRASAALGIPEASPELMRDPIDAMSPLRCSDAARTAARAGNVELAVRLLDQARGIAEEQGLRGQQAMVDAQTAEMMLHRGSALEAKNLLLAAQPVFAELEMVMLQGYAQALLARVDEALTRRSSRFGSLSERELQVAELVAVGMKNREIAARLVISRRTVENHVARVLRKLGIENRQDLTALVMDDEGP
ncbi:helix-turn-helix transcriptional regulator [Microbacterium sp.]|uniref:helix-turn-helix transcriptional regulator n=1 Tax=Microbacterium sp. TaxID=51671 RepID=UPI003F99692A